MTPCGSYERGPLGRVLRAEVGVAAHEDVAVVEEPLGRRWSRGRRRRRVLGRGRGRRLRLPLPPIAAPELLRRAVEGVAERVALLFPGPRRLRRAARAAQRHVSHAGTHADGLNRVDPVLERALEHARDVLARDVGALRVLVRARGHPLKVDVAVAPLVRPLLRRRQGQDRRAALAGGRGRLLARRVVRLQSHGRVGPPRGKCHLKTHHSAWDRCGDGKDHNFK